MCVVYLPHEQAMISSDKRVRETAPGHVRSRHYHEGTVMRRWTPATSETVERNARMCVRRGKHTTEDHRNCRFRALGLLDTC